MSVPVPGEPIFPGVGAASVEQARSEAMAEPSEALPFSEAAVEAAATLVRDGRSRPHTTAKQHASDILAAAADADPRAKACLALAALTDEELVELVKGGLMAHWESPRARTEAQAVLAALGLPVVETGGER